MRIYLMRHGETDYNIRGLIQGTLDIPLNENGIELARLTCDGFRREGLSFDLAYCSPLTRARQTAELILEGTNTPIVYDERIAELNFGEGEGVALAEVKTNPDYANVKKLFDHPSAYVATEQGESFEHLLARVADFTQKELYENEKKYDNVLVCCHGATIRAFLNNMKQQPLEEFWNSYQPNCSVNIVDITDQMLQILEEHRTYYTLPESKKGTIL